MVCGYIVCSSDGNRPLHLPRSYYKVIELGYMTKDPAAYFDPNVCAKYIKPKPPAGKRQHVERRRKISVSSMVTLRPTNAYPRPSKHASRDLNTGNEPTYPSPHF